MGRCLPNGATGELATRNEREAPTSRPGQSGIHDSKTELWTIPPSATPASDKRREYRRRHEWFRCRNSRLPFSPGKLYPAGFKSRSSPSTRGRRRQRNPPAIAIRKTCPAHGVHFSCRMSPQADGKAVAAYVSDPRTDIVIGANFRIWLLCSKLYHVLTPVVLSWLHNRLLFRIHPA